MRLIDADALIDKAETVLDEHETIWFDAVSVNNIHSAPTIEPKTKVVAQVTFDEDKLREIVHEAVEQIKEEYDIVDRPKGKWIKSKTHASMWVCSNCDWGYQDCYDFDFCPQCGADMRGEDNEAD